MQSTALDHRLTKAAALALRALFFIAVAAIPVAINQVTTDFMIEGCMPGTQCLTEAMPLIVNIGLVKWAAYLLLWPLSAWFLGGRWVISRIGRR